MKFLHTSDWHLGMTYKGGISYEADQKYFIDQIGQIAVREQVDGILLAGDVFDKSIASKEALELYNDAMTYLCGKLGIPVYLVAGNHDGAERISACNELLKKSGLYIAGALTEEVNVVRLGDVDLYLLPWISTDKVKTIFPDRAEEITSMESAYQVVLNHYRESFVEGHTNILIAHAFIASAETSVSDRAAEVGRATMVGSFVFDGFDYVALGHIHGPQQITKNIRYCGTPMAYSFGKEENQEKSVTIFDTQTNEVKTVPLQNLHTRKTLTGTYEELLKADFAEEIRNGYLRLEVTDAYIGLEALAAFRERYPNLCEVSGKSMEREDAKITMTLDEFEDTKTSPEEVFARYCADILEEVPDEHMKALFADALVRYEKEVNS